MFKFTNLRDLHEDMKKKREDRVIFPFSYSGKGFSCVFLGDILPYRLYLTALGNSSVSFEILVNEAYMTNTYLEDYKKLIMFLELKYDPTHTFKPSDFFDALNKKIPKTFTAKPSYKDVLSIKSGKRIEESDKLNFCGWRHSPTGRVTEDNLEKTRKAFGDKYATMSKNKGISSCWTDDDNMEDIAKLCRIVSMT